MIIGCFGVRDYEKIYFTEINKKYNFKLELYDYLINDDNYYKALNYEVIMVRGNCNLNANSIKKLYENGLKIILTRTVGIDHLDIDMIKKLDIKCFNVPIYSKYAIAEHVLGLVLLLLRNYLLIDYNINKLDFRFKNEYFSKELTNLSVGIIGCGKIGESLASIFNKLGSKVYGYDLIKKESCNFIYKDFSYIIENCDVISINIPYNKINYHLINYDVIKKMKKGVIIINTSRGEILDLGAILKGFDEGIIGGCAVDVIEKEKDIFNKKHEKLDYYPLDMLMHKYKNRFFITPHVASATNIALENMIDISFKNLYNFINYNRLDNEIKKGL